MKRLTLLLAFLIPISLFSQITFEKTFGGAYDDFGMAVRQTYDDGYIIVGTTFDTIDKVLLIKTNENGDTLWTRRLGKAQPVQTNEWSGYDVQQSFDSGYIIAGAFHEYTDDIYAFLTKTNREGQLIWSKTFSFEQNLFNYGYSVQQTQDSGYIVVGSTWHYVENFGGMYLIKTNITGEVEWEKLYKGSINGDTYGRAVQQTNDGGYLVGGQTQISTGNAFYALLIKTNEIGDTLWTKKVGDMYSDVKAIQKVDNNKYMIGVSGGAFFNETMYSEILIFDGDGHILWAQDYEYGNKYTTDMHQTYDGDYIFTGYSYYGGEEIPSSIFLFKADSTGDSLWFNEFGGGESDKSYSVRPTNDGGYIFVGFTKSFGNGESDVYLVKTNGDGIMTWSNEYPFDEGINKRIYPNPFSTSTTIEYTLYKPQTVSITFYNQFGKQVDVIEQNQQQGLNKILWNPPNLVDGVYYFRFRAGDQVSGGKIVLMK